MAVAFSSYTGHSDTNPTTSCSITLPTTAANDILILQAINGGANAALTRGGTFTGTWAAIGTPSGWTTGHGGVWWARCTGNHSGQTVTFSGATDSISAGVMRVTGCITTGNPYDTNIAEETEGAAANMSLAAFSTTVADTLVVFAWSFDDNQAVTSPTKSGSAMGNLSTKVSGGGADSGVGLASSAQAGTGTTGAFANTVAAGTNSGKRLTGFALKPPPPPTATSTAKVSLEGGDTPDVDTGHTLHVRARKASGSGTVTLTAAVYEGANNRSGDLTTSALTTSLATYDLAVSEANAANITDYSNLDVWWHADSSTGDAVSVEVAEVWFEIPGVEAGPADIPMQAASGAASATLALKAETRVTLAAATSTATATLSVKAPTRVTLASASSTTAATLQLSQIVHLDAASSTATTTLALTAKTTVPLGAATATASATCEVTVPTVSVFAWYKADDLSLGDGDPVASWPDASAGNRDLTQSTGSAQPSFQTNEMNGLPVVRMADAGDYVTGSGFASVGQPFHVFMVVKGEMLIDQSFDVFYQWFGSTGVADLNAGTTLSFDGASNANTVLLTFVLDGASSSIRVNRSTVVSGDAGSGASGTTGINLEANGLVDYGEVIFYDGILDDTTRDAVEAALLAKWFGPAVVPLGAASGAATATLALTAPTRVTLAAATSTATATLALTAPAKVTLAAATSTATATLALTAPAKVVLGAASGLSSATCEVTIPTAAVEVPLDPASGQSSATLALTAPAKVVLAAASGAASATLNLAQYVSPAPASATATASLALKAPTTVTLAPATGQSSATAAVYVPSSTVPLATAVGQASATLALTAQTRIPLQTASAASSATLALTAATRVVLQAAAGQASATCVVYIPTFAAEIPLAPASGQASATLTVKARTTIVFDPASGAAVAVLALSAKTTVPLNPASAVSAATLHLITGLTRWPLTSETRWNASTDSRWPVTTESRW